MEVTNKLIPNEEQLKGFLEPAVEGPIYMVNLLEFREKAEYEDGRETGLSGIEAYRIYATGVGQLLPQFGGCAGFSAGVERLMLGEVEELWDSVAIAMYPSRQAMLDMIQSEHYRGIAVHRMAGLAG
jgi:uncharacterized protein (DUF1330 family)